MIESKATVWTAWSEYGATGEGHAVMARVGGAVDEKQCREQFTAKFGEFYAMFCQVQQGIVRNAATELLWSPRLFNFLEGCTNPAAVEVHAQLYANFS